MTGPDWVFRPEDFLGYLKRVYRVPASGMEIPGRLVLVFGGDDWRALRRAFRASPFRWHRWLLAGRAGRQPVAVLRTMIGAPAAITGVEEAAALGARRILALGACGSLVRDLPIGSIVIADRAYSDEGTSRHYDGGRWARPEPGLLDSVRRSCVRHSLPFREGGVWTTDAPYRESRSRVRSLPARGVVAVEMEMSAIFNVARRVGLRAAAILAISDELGGARWRPGFLDPSFERGKRRARTVVADVMSRGYG